jgi:Uma2 family endonuclease
MQADLISSKGEEENGPPKDFVSTRHRDTIPPDFNNIEPRIGRRESEPHSAEVTYLFHILKENFPNDRVIWDLHHYFNYQGNKINIQFDVSYIKDIKIKHSLSSYRANEYKNRVPNMAVNILSKSTWKVDIGENMDYCRLLKIPVYIIFSPYNVASSIYKPPFIRAYLLNQTGNYEIIDIRDVCFKDQKLIENNVIKSEAIPFWLGLIQLEEKHENDLPRFRIIVINPKTKQNYLLNEEKFYINWQSEKQRADEEKQRADELAEQLAKIQEKS